MEKLLLRGIAAGDKLNVVQHQHIDVAEAVAKFHVLVVLDGGDQLVGEHLAGQIEHAHVREMILNEVADGVHQVRLAQADAAVEEQRVIGHARLLGDGQRVTAVVMNIFRMTLDPVIMKLMLFGQFEQSFP